MPADCHRGYAGERDDPLSDVADEISAPTTVLVAGTVDPTEYAISLRLLSQMASPDDTGIVVTTTEGRDAVVAYTRDVDTNMPSLAVVDTVSEEQYLTAPYEEIPTVYMPSADDLERVVIGLTDLTGTAISPTGSRHFVIRSLTPMVEGATSERVCRVLERVRGLRVGDGLGIFGIDFTAHNDQTMAELTSAVDRLLWVSEDTDGQLQFELRKTDRGPTY